MYSFFLSLQNRVQPPLALYPPLDVDKKGRLLDMVYIQVEGLISKRHLRFSYILALLILKIHIRCLDRENIMRIAGDIFFAFLGLPNIPTRKAHYNGKFTSFFPSLGRKLFLLFVILCFSVYSYPESGVSFHS